MAGTIAFAPKVDFATGVQARSMSIEDIDGDGKKDIARANFGGATLSVLRNTSTVGIIRFATQVVFTSGANPYSVSIGGFCGLAGRFIWPSKILFSLTGVHARSNRPFYLCFYYPNSEPRPGCHALGRVAPVCNLKQKA